MPDTILPGLNFGANSKSDPTWLKRSRSIWYSSNALKIKFRTHFRTHFIRTVAWHLAQLKRTQNQIQDSDFTYLNEAAPQDTVVTNGDLFCESTAVSTYCDKKFQHIPARYSDRACRAPPPTRVLAGPLSRYGFDKFLSARKKKWWLKKKVRNVFHICGQLFPYVWSAFSIYSEIIFIFFCR